MAWLKSAREGFHTGIFVLHLTHEGREVERFVYAENMIVGIGVDLCEVDRIEAAIARHGERFLTRIYTEAERAYCDSKPNRMERFAGRFAAKEAAMKAIGTGWRRGVAWRDFDVARAASGQPVIVFGGEARKIAEQMGVKRALVSITHIKSMAMAQVVLESE